MIRCWSGVLAALLAMPGPLVAADYVVVHAGKLLDVPGAPVKEEASVVVRDGLVVSVEKGFVTASALSAAQDDRVTIQDLSEYFVLPGLIDGHVHITDQLNAGAKLRRVELSHPATALFAANNARVTLLAGFTTVRDLGGRGGDAVFALRDAIKNGYVPGPRIFAAGDVISPTGGHGQRHGYRDDVFAVIKHTGVCDGADDCRRTVRNQIRRSADQIKYVSTGGVLSDTAAGTGQQFFDDEQNAIVQTAHSLGRRVTAHAHNADGINAALRAGVDSIEHGTFANAESIRLFKQTGAYLVPTILAGATVAEIARDADSFFAPAVRAKALRVGPQLIENVGLLHRNGVRIAFGTDSYVSQHGDNAREFSLLVEAGLTPLEAIVTATVHGADNLGKSDVLGTLEAGKYADLIAVSGDPTVNVEELRDVVFVMKQGVVYKQPYR
ncbi:MAG: amidohydrolase family protein [Pseudomonadota bacterium]